MKEIRRAKHLETLELSNRTKVEQILDEVKVRTNCFKIYWKHNKNIIFWMIKYGYNCSIKKINEKLKIQANCFKKILIEQNSFLVYYKLLFCEWKGEISSPCSVGYLHHVLIISVSSYRSRNHSTSTFVLLS